MKLIAAVLALSVTTSAAATAQGYPSHPITIIVPFAPGGPTDTIGRIMAERMRQSLGQPVVIENVTGAGGSIGVGRAARAAPDGYVLSMGNLSSHVFNGAVYSLQYDLLHDFAPVALLPSQPNLIVGRKDLPASDLKGLIAWLKANPDKATQGSPGAGTAAHIMGVSFMKETGTHFTFVPYRGAGPAMQALVAGQVDVMFDTPSTSMAHIRAGAIKAFAVTAKSRIASAPEIPTIDEAGLPGFYFSFWQAFWVPKGTPPEIIGKLNAAVLEAYADPAVRKRLTDLTQDIPPREQQTPEALGALHKAEIEKWWPIVKAAGITAQ